MINKKKALLIGDYTHPKFYPLQGVDKEITHILNDSFTVQCTENNHMLEQENLQSFDLCISYHDSWREKLSSKQTAGLLSCISGGRGLLILHNGIVLHKKYEVAQLIGARNVAPHPSIKQLKFRMTAQEHDVTRGIASFELEDEPYRFEFDPFCETSILMEYEFEGEWYPAAWAHSYGVGRVVYLLPGRDQGVFQHPEYRKLVLQAAKWAARSPV